MRNITNMFVLLVAFVICVSSCNKANKRADQTQQKPGQEVLQTRLPKDTSWTIKVVLDKDSSISFLGDGEFFEKDQVIPLTLYWTDSKGRLQGLGALVACPFVQVNPTLLDLSEVNYNFFPVALSEDNSRSSAIVVFDCRKYDKFHIDRDFVVWPKQDDWDVWGGDDGPFIGLVLYDSAKRRVPWDLQQYEITIRDSNNKCSTRFFEDTLLIVSSVPRECLTMTLSEKDSDKRWVFDFFSSFRGSLPGIVIYKIRNFPP